MSKTGPEFRRKEPKHRYGGANRDRKRLMLGADRDRSEAFRRTNREQVVPTNNLTMPYSDPWINDPDAPVVPPEHDFD
jgi:hypothetical protein